MSVLEKAIATEIRAACPSDEQCIAAGKTCSYVHPIHEVARIFGVTEMVEADVDALAALVMRVLLTHARGELEVARLAWLDNPKSVSAYDWFTRRRFLVSWLERRAGEDPDPGISGSGNPLGEDSHPGGCAGPG